MFLLLVLVLVTTQSASQTCDTDDNEKITFIDCPNDCSQYERRFEGDGIFKCKIGGKRDVDKFLNNNKYLLAENGIVKFEQPVLLGVGSYWHEYNDIYSLSLTITFRLPPGHRKEKGELVWHEQPKAVFLRFQSVADQNVMDEYYYQCSRERIFQFDKYNTTIGEEIEHPRNLTYGCLVGLDKQNNEYNVYKISLWAAEGRNITYTVSVPVVGRRAGVWKPVVATYLNVTHRSLDVIVEQFPNDFQTTKFVIKLVNTLDKSSATKKTKENSTRFENLTQGKYTINIMYDKCPENKCLNFTPYHVDAMDIPGQKSESVDPLGPEKLAAMVTGCILGVLVVVTSIYCLLQKRVCKTEERINGQISVEKGAILHPFDPENDQDGKYSKLKELKAYLEESCDCKIILKASLPTLADDINEFSSGCSFVLVFFTQDCYSCAPNEANVSYSNTWDCLLKREREKSDLHIIPVTFSVVGNVDQPPFLSHRKICTLMKDIQEVYCQMHSGISKGDLQVLRPDVNHLTYKDTPHGGELFALINEPRDALLPLRLPPSQFSLPQPYENGNRRAELPENFRSIVKKINENINGHAEVSRPLLNGSQQIQNTKELQAESITKRIIADVHQVTKNKTEHKRDVHFPNRDNYADQHESLIHSSMTREEFHPPDDDDSDDDDSDDLDFHRQLHRQRPDGIDYPHGTSLHHPYSMSHVSIEQNRRPRVPMDGTIHPLKGSRCYPADNQNHSINNPGDYQNHQNMQKMYHLDPTNIHHYHQQSGNFHHRPFVPEEQLLDQRSPPLAAQFLNKPHVHQRREDESLQFPSNHLQMNHMGTETRNEHFPSHNYDGMSVPNHQTFRQSKYLHFQNNGYPLHNHTSAMVGPHSCNVQNHGYPENVNKNMNVNMHGHGLQGALHEEHSMHLPNSDHIKAQSHEQETSSSGNRTNAKLKNLAMNFNAVDWPCEKRTKSTEESFDSDYTSGPQNLSISTNMTASEPSGLDHSEALNEHSSPGITRDWIAPDDFRNSNDFDQNSSTDIMEELAKINSVNGEQ